ncbi:virion structural protein [Clostridioides difficile]|nr:virion structural protein [Clostridioides difficile]
MNNYKYKRPSILFEERIKILIEDLNKDFDSGKIKTKTEYFYEFKNMIIDFYNKLGKPLFEFHEAVDIPSFSSYSDMLKKAKCDMHILICSYKEIGNNLQIYFKDVKEENELLINKLNCIEIEINELDKKVDSLKTVSNMIYSDDFTKISNINNLNNVSCSVLNRALTLATISSKCVNDNINIQILDVSNGFPGNTHEIYSSYNKIKYIGEDDPHIYLSDILDGNDDTWFEFEMYNLEDDIKIKTAMVGFKYKEGISWISDDKILKLHFKIVLDIPVNINWFKISGIPNQNVNLHNPIIKRIVVRDKYENVQILQLNESLKEENIITFKSSIVKEIVVELEQEDSNFTKVCREYFLNIDPTKIPYFFYDNNKDYIQFDKPQKSIEIIGLKYNHNNKNIIYPSTKSTNKFSTREYVKSQLFYKKISEDSYKFQYEEVNAKRYVIGIKNIELKYKVYDKYGVYLSEKFLSTESIRSITLNSKDYIPRRFMEYLDENKKIDDYIKYYISFDDGSVWTRIRPRHRAEYGSCAIVINSNISTINRNKNITYVDMLNDVNEFRLKIELDRPDEIIDESPIVYNYRIDVGSEEII